MPETAAPAKEAEGAAAECEEAADLVTLCSLTSSGTEHQPAVRHRHHGVAIGGHRSYPLHLPAIHVAKFTLPVPITAGQPVPVIGAECGSTNGSARTPSQSACLIAAPVVLCRPTGTYDTTDSCGQTSVRFTQERSDSGPIPSFAPIEWTAWFRLGY
jgi:hypothetical protein